MNTEIECLARDFRVLIIFFFRCFKLNRLAVQQEARYVHPSIHQQYQDDDELIGIDGTPVKTFDDIRKAAKDWKSGDAVALTLKREGKEISLPITLSGAASKKPPLEPGPH